MLERLDRFFEEHPTKSRLKYGLRFVSHQLWDEVLGWAVTRGHWDDADLQAIDAYLFGGTVFRYATIFGGSFSRSAFVEALAAGVRDEPFPLRAILLATREKYPTLSVRATPGGGAAKRHRRELGGPAAAGGPQRSACC